MEYLRDDELGYAAERTRFAAGQRFDMDETYRLAQLPLVASGHPRAIAAKPGTTYDHGRHTGALSLVLPVPGTLHDGDAWHALERELRAGPLGARIAWPLLPRRRDRLHATLCPALTRGGADFRLSPEMRRALAEIGPIDVEVRGLFSGTRNLGRLYGRVYPARTRHGNPLQAIQRALGRPETGLYLVGLLNLVDDLDPAEAAALAALIERWWDRPLLRLRVDNLWLLEAWDDLVLDGRVVESVPLS